MKKIAQIALTECQFLLRSRQTLFALVLLPAFLCFFLASIYSAGHVTALPLFVCDLDESRSSRDLIQMFSHHEAFGEMILSQDITLGEQLLSTGDVRIIVIIPKGFALKINKGIRTDVMTISDSSNLIFPNMGLTAAAEIIKTYSTQTGYRVMLKEKITPEAGLTILKAISFRELPLYNPSFSYAYFLTFGIILALLQIVYVLGPAQAIAREKDQGTWPQLALADVSPWQLILGKALPYFLCNLSLSLLCLGVGELWFNVPISGDYFSLLVFIAVFIASLTSLGILCSVLADSSLDASRYTLPFVLPAFVLSGFTWPLEAFPTVWRWLSVIFPLTWGLKGFKSIAVYGGNLGQALLPCVVLLLMSLALFGMAGLIVKQSEKQSSDEVFLSKLQEVLAK
jgi:ABC-2 type transport system permease protein